MSKKGGVITIIKDTFALFAITLVAAVLLSLVREVTAEPIAKREEQDKQNAYLAVFTDAKSVKESKDVPELKAAVEAADTVLSEDVKKEVSINEACLAMDVAGKPLGYIITVTDKKGFGGAIKMVFGCTLDGSITGIEFLTISETAGFGLEAQKDKQWRTQYYGDDVAEYSVVKTGATRDNEIDALSGATITSKAVTKGINGGLQFAAYLTEQGIGGVK